MKRTLSVVFAALSLFACSSDDATSADELTVGNTFGRVVLGRMFVNGERTLPYEESGDYVANVASIFANANVHPTYVSGLVRHNGPLAGAAHALTPEERSVYAKMRAALPGAKLDVVLSPVVGGSNGQKLSADALTKLMENIEKDVHPDVWFFDFFTDGDPIAVEAAIKFAHQHGQLVGGNYFGSANDARGTADANFFAVADDACGDLGTSAEPHSAQSLIDALHQRWPNKPVLVHANNNAQNGGPVQCKDGSTQPETFACTFNDWSTSRRLSYVGKRAAQQKKRGFVYMFNAFFPACAKGDPNADPLKVYYDAHHDGVFGQINQLMN